jgi:hypothetical protein
MTVSLRKTEEAWVSAPCYLLADAPEWARI